MWIFWGSGTSWPSQNITPRCTDADSEQSPEICADKKFSRSLTQQFKTLQHGGILGQWDKLVQSKHYEDNIAELQEWSLECASLIWINSRLVRQYIGMGTQSRKPFTRQTFTRETCHTGVKIVLGYPNQDTVRTKERWFIFGIRIN